MTTQSDIEVARFSSVVSVADDFLFDGNDWNDYCFRGLIPDVRGAEEWYRYWRTPIGLAPPLWARTARQNAKEAAKSPKASKRHVPPSPEQLALPLDLGRVLVRNWGRAGHLTTPARLAVGPTQPPLPPKLVWQALHDALKPQEIPKIFGASKKPEKREPRRGDSPEAKGKRAALAAKLAKDPRLYYGRRAEWARKVNGRLQEGGLVRRLKLEAPEVPEFTRRWKRPDWSKGVVYSLETRDWWKYAPRPRTRKPFGHFEWDKMTGLGVARWVPHGPCVVMGRDDKGKEYRRGPDLSKYLWEHDPPRPESLLVPPDRDQADCVDIGGYEHGRGYKVWHVPDAVEGYPARAKREAKSARAVLRSRTKAAKRGVVWVGTERLGKPKRLADEYEFWVQPMNSGAWIPGSLFVVVCDGHGHPDFRSVVQRENRKITQRNKNRRPQERMPLLVAFEATPSDFDPLRYRIRFTGKPSEPDEHAEGYPGVRADHTEEYRKPFLDLFGEWKEKKWDKEKKRWYNPPLELGPPVVPTNVFYTDPKLAMFWTDLLDASESPELDINWQWRRDGIREAIADPARRSKWITKERKRYINREHYLNGLMVLTSRLKLPPPITWRAPVDFVSHSGQTIKRAGERFNLGSEDTEEAARVIARQRAKRRQVEAAYTLAGYVSATTGRRHVALAQALESVKEYYKDHPFRAALNMELPGATYLAAFDGHPEDREYGKGGKDSDVTSGRYARSARAYNEQLRKLGYREYKDGEGWAEVPEGKPLPKNPLETEIRGLAKDARSHVLYANRRCRRDFGNVWKVRDGDGRRKLLPDTRSDGTDPGNGYQNSKDWQEYDSSHEPDPAEYDIEVAMAEGDVLVPGSSHADPELNPDLWEKLRNEEMLDEDTLALSAEEPKDVDWEAENASLTPDFDTHHSLNLRVDEKGEKHLVRLEFAQSIAVKGFREFALNYDPEKYGTAYEKGMLPDYERQQLCPSYREAVLLDLLGEGRLPGISEDGGTFVRYEDEETGERHTVKTSKLADLRHELDGEGPSRFGLTQREREVFGCYYGTSHMTLADIAERLKIAEITVKREMKAVRKRLAENGIRLPAQAQRRGRKAA